MWRSLLYREPSVERGATRDRWLRANALHPAGINGFAPDELADEQAEIWGVAVLRRRGSPMFAQTTDACGTRLGRGESAGFPATARTGLALGRRGSRARSRRVARPAGPLLRNIHCWPDLIAAVATLEKQPGVALLSLAITAAGTGRSRRFTRIVVGLRLDYHQGRNPGNAERAASLFARSPFRGGRPGPAADIRTSVPALRPPSASTAARPRQFRLPAGSAPGPEARTSSLGPETRLITSY